MSDIKTHKKLRLEGERLGRAGLSKRVCDLVAEFDGSYVGAMILAGRMRAIATAAGCDDYWTEKVQRGYWSEVDGLPRVPKPEPEAEQH